MTDLEIIDLYGKRNESAIAETAKSYGTYCTKIAMNVLANREDADECVNDTWLKAWYSIPPERPSVLAAFLGRIARNTALDRYKSRKASKRAGDDMALLLSELDGCVPSGDSVEDEYDARALEREIDRFLTYLKQEERLYFVRRYWYNDSIAKIAERYDVGESKVKTNLHRTRNKLKTHLEEQGIMV
jgi:RNA polymerase sigma-70 factor (ECF subfamily)